MMRTEATAADEQIAQPKHKARWICRGAAGAGFGDGEGASGLGVHWNRRNWIVGTGKHLYN